MFFNIAGPCFPGEHYILPPERRLGDVMALIEGGRYFTLRGGRQTGKTTSAQWLRDHYNAGEACRVAWVDLQTARVCTDVASAMQAILAALDHAIEKHVPLLRRPPSARVEELLSNPSVALVRYLQEVCAGSPLPLVLLLDEADVLSGAPMVSFLTQLRDGYIARRESAFPQSIVLIGQRAVRDYVVSAGDQGAVAWLGTASPFNIIVEDAELGPFTEAEVGELLAQHTKATGQVFESGAVERVWYLSQGHPWLVNALADQIVRRDVKDRAVPITPAHVERAKETIILERRTHIDSLMARLREPRVSRVLDPMLSGEPLPGDVLDDDVAYVRGLGLIRRAGAEWQVANPIYREVIPRALTFLQQTSIHVKEGAFVRADGSLDMPKLMTAWQKFWRIDGHLAAEGFAYREAGPHLMLMAFLQRVVNGGGRIEREYGLGRRALDLLVEWKDERYAIETKLRRDTETEADALEQVSDYLDTLGLSDGWLVMFDLRSTLPWTERLWQRTVEVGMRRIHMVGC